MTFFKCLKNVHRLCKWSTHTLARADTPTLARENGGKTWRARKSQGTASININIKLRIQSRCEMPTICGPRHAHTHRKQAPHKIAKRKSFFEQLMNT